MWRCLSLWEVCLLACLLPSSLFFAAVEGHSTNGKKNLHTGKKDNVLTKKEFREGLAAYGLFLPREVLPLFFFPSWFFAAAPSCSVCPICQTVDALFDAFDRFRSFIPLSPSLHPFVFCYSPFCYDAPLPHPCHVLAFSGIRMASWTWRSGIEASRRT